MEYIFIWRKDFESIIGPWVLGLFEGTVIAVLAATVILAFALQRKEVEKEERWEYLV